MFKTPKFDWYGRGFRLRAAITIVCQLAFVLFGYDQGVFSGIVGNQDFLNTFDHPSPALEGIIVSIYNLGAFSGCILAFIFGEYTGRRLAMWIAMVWIIVGCEMFEGEILLINAGWRSIADMRIFCASYHGRTLFDRNRHWHRNVDCSHVPKRTLRSKQARSPRFVRATLCWCWYCHRILVRLWHVLHIWFYRVAIAYCMPDPLCNRECPHFEEGTVINMCSL